MTHNSRLRGGPRLVRGGYPGPFDQPPSVVPGHDSAQSAPYADRVPPDIRQLNDEQRGVARSRFHQRGPSHGNAVEVEPIGLSLVPGVVLTGATALHAPGVVRSVLVLVFPYNRWRKRLIVSNPDFSGTTVYFCFGNNANNLITVPPGAVWDESGSGVSTDEVYVATSTANQQVGCYEGMIDQQASR